MTTSARHGDELVLTVPDALAGLRVDRAVALLSGLPRREVTELVASGRVWLDGDVVGSRHRAVGKGQVLRVELPARAPGGPGADGSVAFGVVYEDADLVVVDKPAGLVVHHGAGHRGGTLVDGLLARYPELARAEHEWADPTRPGIVHRLDKGTSGLLVVARTAEAFTTLTNQLRAHRAEREYIALVSGTMAADEGTIDAPIGRSSRAPTRMALTPRGRPARTGYRVRGRYRTPAPTTLLDVRLETGRTHQVRVHLAAIGHPVVGDQRYASVGGQPSARGSTDVARLMPAGRVFLHAARLSVDHPNGVRMTWESPLPADLVEVLAHLGT